MKRIRASFSLIIAVAGVLATSCTREARVRSRLASANEQFTAGRYEAAEIGYKNVLQRDHLNAEAISRLGQMYQTQGRIGPAIAYLTKAKELRPNDTETRISLGLAFFVVGAPARAREEAAFVLKQNPNDLEAPVLLVEASRSAAELGSARATLELLPTKAKAPALVALGQVQLRSGRTRDGERLFEQALAADPKSATAHAAVGMLAWARKDLAAADQHLRLAAELSSPRSSRRLQYAQFQLQTGDTDAGKLSLQRLTQQVPDYIPAWLARIERAAAESDYTSAESILREALAHDPTHPELLLLSGRVQMAKGDVDKGIAELERVTSLYPRLPAAWYALGSAYATKGQLDKAGDNLSQALALVPDYSAAIFALADVNIRQGNYPAAVKALKPIVGAHPENQTAQLLLAQAYRGQGDLAAALATYQRLENDGMYKPEAAYLRGLVLRDQGQPAAARAAFETAAVLNPTSLEPIARLVELDAAEKMFDRADARVRRALPKLPKTAEPYLLLGGIHLAAQDLPAAQKAYEAAIKAQPESPAAYLMLARTYVAKNEHAKAIEQMQVATTKNPTNAEAHTVLGVLWQLTGKNDLAIGAYTKVLEIDPRSVAALNNLAGLLVQDHRQIARAYELADRARKLAPDDPSVADTLGWILYHQGLYPQSLALLRTAASKIPDERAVQFHLGMAAYMNGDEGMAKTSLERAIQGPLPPADLQLAKRKVAILTIDSTAVRSDDRLTLEAEASEIPTDPAASIRLARLQISEGALDKALLTTEKAYKGAPKHAGVVAELARIMCLTGHKDAAREHARSAHALAPADPEITALLGQLAYESGQYRWAAALLEDAANQLPTQPDVALAWANAAYAVGRATEARTATRHALDVNPSFARSNEARRLLELIAIAAEPHQAKAPAVADALRKAPTYGPALVAQAALEEQRDDFAASQKTYETLAKVWPEFSPAHRALALIYARRHEGTVTAASIAAKARQAFPEDPQVARAVGIINYQQREYARAATLLQESSAALPHDSEGMFYLGMSQYQLKNAAQAKQTLQRALALGLEKELAQEARRIVAIPN